MRHVRFARGRKRQHARHRDLRIVFFALRELDRRQCQQQIGIVAGRLGAQIGTGAVGLSRRDELPCQPITKISVERVDFRGIRQQLKRFVASLLLLEDLGGVLEELDGAKRVANRLRGVGCRDLRLDVGAFKRSQAEDAFCGAPLLATALALLRYLVEILFRVGELSLALADLSQLHQDVFVVRLHLQRLLVERRRLWQKAL